MARLGKRERAAKKALIAHNLAHRPERSLLPGSNVDKLRGAMCTARGPRWSDTMERKSPARTRFSDDGFNKKVDTDLL